MNLPSLLLASSSEARIRLLTQAGLHFQHRPARIDEEMMIAALLAEGASPRDLAETLAEHKARKIATDDETLLTLGSDQVLAIKGEVFQKPKDRIDAAHHLSRLQGQTHHLYSAAVIYEGIKPVWRHIGAARMTMHTLNTDEIEAYLSKAWPDVAGCVGAYKAEGLGAQLFSRIEGDWFSVQGLPLLNVLSYLRQRGKIGS